MSSESSNCEPITNSPERRPSSSILARVFQNHPYPISAGIELTTSCNFACPHCYVLPSDSSNELTKVEILDLLDQLMEMRVLVLTFTGGESTLREDFFEIIEEAINRRFVVTLKSNAFLLGAKEIQTLSNLGLYILNVSLYHSKKEKHDGFVGRMGSWERAVQALRLFKKSGRNSRVSIMVMNWNIDDILSLERFCQAEQWDYLLDFRIERRSDGDLGPTRHRANDEELVDILCRSEQLSKRILADRNKTRLLETVVCGAANMGLFVKANGMVIPCSSLSQFPLGSIREKKLAQIWKQSESLRGSLSVRWSDEHKCKSCDLFVHCNRCPATAFLEHGHVSSPSELDCQLAKVRHLAYKRIIDSGR